MGSSRDEGVIATMNVIGDQPRELSDHLAVLGGYQLIHAWYPKKKKKIYKSPLTNYNFGVAMGRLFLRQQNFKKVKLIFYELQTCNFIVSSHQPD